MPKLTKRAIDELKPSHAPVLTWDAELRGFGVLTMPSGLKTFVLQYRTAGKRSRRMTIGRYGVLTVDQARSIARDALVRVSQGGDPMSERRSFREAPTLDDLLTRYLAEHVASHNAASTRADVTALVEKHIRPRLGSIKVDSFTRADASKLHTAMKATPRRANHALAVLSKALSLAEIWGWRPANSNPCGNINRYAENHRKRFLNAAEIQRVGEALIEAETIGLPWRVAEPGVGASKHLPSEEDRRTMLSWQVIAAIRLLLLTGARLSEILSLKWSDVDDTAGTVALPGRKGGKREPHPVSSAALIVLTVVQRVPGSPYVLPRSSDSQRHISREVMESAWGRVRWRAAIEDVRLHDLRHTVGTYGAQAGVSAFIVRDLLRHTNISTTGRYANFDMDPVRNVSNIIGERIMAGLSKKTR